MNITETLAPFRYTLIDVWSRGDQNSWPIKTSDVAHILLPQMYEPFLNALLSDNNELVTPSMIFRSFDFLIRGMLYKKEKKAINQSNIYYILERVKSIKYGDYLNKDGKNIIWDDNIVNNYYKSNMFGFVYDKSLFKKVCQLIVLLKTYIELKYFRLYDISQNIHGFYDFEGMRLLVYEFSNLNIEFDGDNREEKLRYNKIQVSMMYSSNANLKIDIYNHLVQEQYNLFDEIVAYQIIVDGKEIKACELDKIIADLENVSRHLYRHIILLSKDDILKRYIYSFNLKLCLLLGNMDCKCFDISKYNYFDEHEDSIMSPEMIRKLIYLAF